jgi:hypothetical protein
MKTIIIAITAMGIVVLINSCAKQPQVEIDNANVAIQAAQTAGADIYVPEAFAALQDSMNAATSSIKANRSKLFKSYKKEKAQLIAIVQLSNDIKLKTEARTDELKTEIQNTLTEITATVAESKELVAKAPRGKEGTTALVATKADLAAIETSVAEVETLLAKGDLIGAENKINALRNPASIHNIEKGNNTTNPVLQDTTLKRATLGYTCDKRIRYLEDGFLRVVVKVNGSREQLKQIVRKEVTEEFQVKLNKGNDSIFFVDNINVYDSMIITPKYSNSDFTLTGVNTEFKQKLYFIEGNQWLWKIKAESKEPHTAIITLEINGLTSKGVHPLAIRHVPIEIAILPPVPKSTWSEIFDWIGKYPYILTTIIIPVFLYYRKKILRYIRSKKDKKDLK